MSPSQASAVVWTWNRTDHVLAVPPWVARRVTDADLTTQLVEDRPHLLWVHGPAPDEAQWLTLTATCPELNSVVVAPVPRDRSGKEFVVLGGSLQKAVAAVKGLQRLSSMPLVAQRILDAVNSNSVEPRQLAELVAPDPALVATILRHANSPYYGRLRQVSDIPSAVVMLGYRQVAELALAASVMDLFRERDPQSEAAWRRRLVVAAVSLRLGRKLLADEAARRPLFVAGMLHDVGRLVLAQVQPALAQQLAALDLDEATYAARCLDALDFHPGDLGAALGRTWNLPVEVEAAARFHHHGAILRQPWMNRDVTQCVWVVMAAIAMTDALLAKDKDRLQRRLAPLCAPSLVSPALTAALPAVASEMFDELSHLPVHAG